MNINPPLLSVCLITYNHQKFIKQAVDSILQQKVNFSWELIIADDCSTDGTREILLDYQKQYPDLIKLILQKKNVGAAQNWLQLITTPKSKYIAYLEGDDYWTDETKLQQQINILEHNPQYSGVFHDTQTLDIKGNLGLIFGTLHQTRCLEFTLDDVISLWSPFHTSSFLFRGDCLLNFPRDFLRYKSGDMALFILVASQGHIRYIPKVMSIYRKQGQGITENNIHQDGYIYFNRYFLFNSLRKELYPKGDEKFAQVIADIEQRLVNFLISLEKNNLLLQTEIRRLRTQQTLAKKEGNYTVVVAHVNPNAYSETFIRTHLENLPAEIINLPNISFPLQQNKKQLKQFFLEKEVDAVLAEYGQVGVAMMNICQELNIPLIVHFHGFDAYHQNILQNVGQFYPILFQQAEATIAVSRDMEQQLLSLGAIREKLHYNPYGVDLSLFQKSHPEKSAILFVAVGRFVDKKAPNLTILAFAQVCQQHPEAKLVIMGDGVLLESCKLLAQSLGISRQVDFLGAVSHEEVAQHLCQARAFVQHSVTASYGDSEGTPNSVIEASATGIPIIATGHAGIKDVVIEGETGFLVDEGDINSMAKYMLKLAKDPVLARKLGEAGRKRVENYFSLERYIGSTWSIIKNAIESEESRRLIQLLNLSESNFIVFPDWTTEEEELAEELMAIITQLAERKTTESITLLIDTNGILIEDAEELLSAINMNILFAYEVDISDYLTISLVTELTDQQWSILLSNINHRIKMQHENKEIVKAKQADHLSIFDDNVQK